MRTRLGVFLLLVCLIVPTAAWGDVYSFWYSGTGVTASGTLTVSAAGVNEWLITGITGTRNGQTITALNTSPLADGTVLDNLIFFTAPSPTSLATFTPTNGYGSGVSGFAFTTSDGVFQPYTWLGGVYPGTGSPNYPAGQYEYKEGTYPSPFTNKAITFTVGVPEPNVVVLLIGMLSVVGMVLRKKKLA